MAKSLPHKGCPFPSYEIQIPDPVGIPMETKKAATYHCGHDQFWVFAKLGRPRLPQ
jgi:hypothetical protein